MTRAENLNLTRVNMDNLNKNWGNCSAKEAQTKFKQSVMTNFFKKHVEQAAQSAKKKNEEASRS